MDAALVREIGASAQCLVSADAPNSSITSTTEIPLRRFTVFPALPTELRLRIWSCALSHDRIIELRSRNDSKTYGIELHPQPKLAVLSLLRVCHESRAEAQKVQWREHAAHLWQSRANLIKLDTDYIYLDFITCVRLRHDGRLLAGVERLVKHLILPSRLFDDHPRDYARAMFEVAEFVEDVTVIVVEGPRTAAHAELITLGQAAERNRVAASLIDSTEVKTLEGRLKKIGEWWGKMHPTVSVPKFRIMAMDRRDGTTMANSFISFRI